MRALRVTGVVRTRKPARVTYNVSAKTAVTVSVRCSGTRACASSAPTRLFTQAADAGTRSFTLNRRQNGRNLRGRQVLADALHPPQLAHGQLHGALGRGYLGRLPRNLVASAYVAFAAFGSFWGAWGASVPRVQDQAGVDDGELGLALLFVGAGALPAMLLAGRALDRFGLRVAAGLIAALGLAGAALALAAHDLVTLSAGLALAGAASGAADVAMNAVAGRAEQLAERPVITRAHGTFSAFVVISSLLTGVLAGADLPLATPVRGRRRASIGAGVAMWRALPPEAPRRSRPRRERAGRLFPLLAIGIRRARLRQRERPSELERGLRPGRARRHRDADQRRARGLRRHRRGHPLLDRRPAAAPCPDDPARGRGRRGAAR